MKKLLFIFTLMLFPMLASAQTVSDVQNSGCTARARGAAGEGPVPTIMLTKEGNILSVEVLNYEANCCTDNFHVTSNINGGSDGRPSSLSISVVPVGALDCDCECPFNVSFTIRDLEPNSFYLKCWWYEGLVELTNGVPLVLEYKVEDVVIGEMSFRLLKVMHKAKLTKWTTEEKEIRIPSEVTYEGENYTVTSIDHDAFVDLDHLAKIAIPKSIRSTDLDVDDIIWANPFRECKSLEWIEVEEGCPLLSSVDGVLFAKNKTMLLGYPIASPRETYTVPEGVTNIRSGSFYHNKYLRKLVIPEGVTYLGWHLFSDTKSLEALYIKGVLDPECIVDGLFGDMSTNVNIYVLPSELDKFKAIYKGPVYPLPEQKVVAYHPMIEEGKVWKVGHGSRNPIQFVEYYYFDGDTIIDGKTCKQMMCQRYVNAEHPDYAIISQLPSLSYVGAWYEENKKVYFCYATNNQFTLMYDFSVDDNATLQIHGQSYVIGPKQTGGIKGFKGTYRDVMMLWDEEQNLYNTTWLEGVGGIEGPIYNVYLGEEYHGGAFLMSCTVGDEVIYLNDEYEDGATPESMNAKKRFDFTHTIKTQPKAPMRRVAEQSLYGEYNTHSVVVNLYPLDETYQVRITDQTGKVFYEKDFNAGNIVGLNINISTYGNGRYTLTMENSHESFTGEFEVQTTGIEEVRNEQEVVRGSIYNLQGQRISTLQKGLNIVNGRKVYVK